MSWCGYIDLLGARQIASRSSQELAEALDSFHSALSDSFDHFKSADCIAFSDGAFFQTTVVANFFPFYSRVRNQLFQSGLFFRCSLLPGSIKFSDRETDGGKYLSKAPPKLRSFQFGGKAPEAYQRESDFKGVGCIIDDDVRKEKNQDNVVQSFFARDGRLFAYNDCKFSSFELSDPKADDASPSYDSEQRILDIMFYNCHLALSQSEKVGSHFLSAIITAVRSEDYSTVDFVDGAWNDAPYLFRKVFAGRGVLKAIRTMPGINFVLLAMFEKLYRDCNGKIPPQVEVRVLARMLGTPSCFRNLDGVPNFVISSKARHRLMELKASHDEIVP